MDDWPSVLLILRRRTVVLALRHLRAAHSRAGASPKNIYDNTCYNAPRLSKRMMKKSIRIGDGVAEFFGTHDGNIKYLESLLKVQVQIDGESNLTIDGNDHDVQLVERLKFENGDLKSIIRIISEDTSQSLRGVVSGAKTLQAGKRTVTPKTLNQKVYVEAI